MSLKKNWPAVHADVEQLFADPPDDAAFETTQTVDLTAGRIEARRHTVCHKVDWMTSDRHYPGEPVFPDLAMIGRIETEVERNGRIEHETRVVRAHWGVENRLHWVLDVIFREDLARFRTGDGPQNMAIIRHTTPILLSRAKPTISLKNRRKTGGWSSTVWKPSSDRPPDVQAIPLYPLHAPVDTNRAHVHAGIFAAAEPHGDVDILA